MNLLYPANLQKGFHQIVAAQNPHLKLLDFALLALQPGENWQAEFVGREAALVILGGKAEVQSGAQSWAEVGERENVFTGRASAVYVPAGGKLEVTAKTAFEAAIITSPATNRGKAVLITPDQVAERTVGRHNWQRSVQDIIDARTPAQRLLVGETYNIPGGWSSYPPHKHDTVIPEVEVCLEEVYHFRIDPPAGFGFQRIYSPEQGLDEAYAIKNGDTVALPFGYHPVAAAPGYKLYYLWALAGDERIMRPHDDPNINIKYEG
jgi:5-deoxy-glucuronate isomerase